MVARVRRKKGKGRDRRQRRAGALRHDAGNGYSLLLDRVQEECARVLRDSLRTEASLEAVQGVMQECYSLFDRLYDEASLDPAPACRRGCHYCCYNQVSLTPPEALCLGMHLRDRFPADRLGALKDRVRDTAKRIRGMSREAIGAMKHELPCPLLEDGTCSAHAVRPLVCRGWNAVSVDPCRRSVEEHLPMVMLESHPLPQDLAHRIGLGLLGGSSEMELEAGYLVLTRALEIVFDTGIDGCAEAWLAGRPFFAARKG